MSLDKRPRRPVKRPERISKQIRIKPSSDDPHEIVYFKRHPADDPTEAVPGEAFLQRCPTSVRATLRAVLVAVATAPPKRYAGGGYWEAMRGNMVGWFEVRVDGPKRHHYRLYCLLDYEAQAQSKPFLVVVQGLDKPFRTTLSDSDYAKVRALGDEYRRRNPRSTV